MYFIFTVEEANKIYHIREGERERRCSKDNKTFQNYGMKIELIVITMRNILAKCSNLIHDNLAPNLGINSFK